MAEQENTTENPQPVTPEKAAEKELIDNLKACEKTFPATLELVRNETPITVNPRSYSRGNKKEYDCKYIGVVDDFYTEENLPTLIAHIGVDKVLGLCKNFINMCHQGATELAVATGSFQLDVYKKAAEEYSARGEPTSELQERLDSEINPKLKEFNQKLTDPQFFANPHNVKAFRDLMADYTYCVETIESRKRGPRQKKTVEVKAA